MRRLINFLPRISIPVLLYHQVAISTPEEDPFRLGVPPARLETQMKYLYEEGFTTITLSEYLVLKENRNEDKDKLVVITFDDGYLDTYTNAFPILQKYHQR